MDGRPRTPAAVRDPSVASVCLFHCKHSHRKTCLQSQQQVGATMPPSVYAEHSLMQSEGGMAGPSTFDKAKMGAMMGGSMP